MLLPKVAEQHLLDSLDRGAAAPVVEETIPHTAIHNYVGGEVADGALGDMTDLATAFDPLFYAHHGNLDRLWEA